MIALLPGGLELGYDDIGTRTPVLFIHGWPHSRALWAGQTSGLVTQARCIVPDLRGFGESSVSGPYGIDRYADDLAELLASLGVARTVVCGLSMGGYVALALVRRHRTLVRGLVLTSTRATADSDDARERRGRLAEFVRAHGVAELAALQLRGMLGATTFEARPEVRESLRELMAASPADGVVGALGAMAARPDATDLLPTIDVPTVVVGGSEDTLTPPDELRALAAAIPSARLELLEGCGHVCAYERPAAFNHVVSELLGSLRYA